ncbi:MAG: SDR family oxidoreductase [Planctomycetaceae bacterium]|nr:SDR family oxidoreductase [Planctomycetaceae bacterium]
MKSFQDRNVLLTGAASGIGRALAQQLAEAGCRLYLVDIDQRALQTVAEDLTTAGTTVWTRVCDLSVAADVDNMLADFDERVGILDLLINNAGVAYYGPTEQMSQQQWDWLMQINLLSPIQITNHFLPHLLTRPDAHIANMCSISGMVAGGRFAAYNTSKFGLIGYTEALRAEYGRKGIGVTAVCPGPVTTNLYKSAAAGRKDTSVPEPPPLLSATPDQVAHRTLHAIRRNKRQQLITPMAYGLYYMKKLTPGLIDFASQVSRKKKKRLAELQRREDERLAQASDQTHNAKDAA